MKPKIPFGCIFAVCCSSVINIIICSMYVEEKERKTHKGEGNMEIKRTEEDKEQQNAAENSPEKEYQKKKTGKELQHNSKEQLEKTIGLEKNKERNEFFCEEMDLRFEVLYVHPKIGVIETFLDFIGNERSKNKSVGPFLEFIELTAYYDTFYYKINKNRTVFIVGLNGLYGFSVKEKGNHETLQIYIEKFLNGCAENLQSIEKNKRWNITKGIASYWDIDSVSSIMNILDESIQKMENKEIEYFERYSLFAQYFRNMLFRVSNSSDEELLAASAYCELLVFNPNNIDEEENEHIKVTLSTELNC